MVHDNGDKFHVQQMRDKQGRRQHQRGIRLENRHKMVVELGEKEPQIH